MFIEAPSGILALISFIIFIYVIKKGFKEIDDNAKV
jgi:hypothetical protein